MAIGAIMAAMDLDDDACYRAISQLRVDDRTGAARRPRFFR